MSLDTLVRELRATDPGDVEAFLASGALEPHQVDAVRAAMAQGDREHQLGVAAAAEWRATPATMANHLTRGARRLWPYVRLIGDRFVEAFGRSCDECLAKPGFPHLVSCSHTGPVAPPEHPHQILMTPSQYGKTSALMDGVVWALDWNPTWRIMYVTYDANKAVEEGGKARDFAREHEGELRFKLRQDRRARGMWRTEQGGGLYCVGMYGGITGWPADAVLLDDLFKGWEAAHSDTQRDTIWNIYRSQVRMRVQSEHSPIVAAGTRWHEDDVPARLMKDAATVEYADQWRVTRLPAIAEPPDPDNADPLLRQPDPLGRAPGEPLEPERFSLREVRARAATLGSYLAASLEQQRPAPVEGTEILRSWWKINEDLPANFDEMLVSWDMKLKDKEAGDYVVGQTWGRVGSQYWMTAQLRGQWNQPTVENAIALAAVREPRARIHVVENTGNGPEVIEALREAKPDYEVSPAVVEALGMSADERVKVQRLRRRGMTGIIPETVKGSKAVRMRVHSGLVESGHAHLWARIPTLAVYLEEMAAFPNGAHDDQIDATSQAFKYLRRGVATIEAPQGKIPETRPSQPSGGPAVRGGPVSGGGIVVPRRPGLGPRGGTRGVR